MKKLTYLLLLMFAVVLMSTSCEENESLTTEEEVVDIIISQADLCGIWEFQNFELNGSVYDEYEFDCNTFTYTMDSEGDMFIFDNQIEIYGLNQDGIILKYVFDKNIIKLVKYELYNIIGGDILLEVEVLSYDDNILKLKLKSSDFNDYVGGILTFKKYVY